MTELSYDTLVNLVSRRFGKYDIACPLCGPERRSPANRKRRVLRIWHLEEGFVTYACARCGERGYARAKDAVASKQSRTTGCQPRIVEASEDADQRSRIEFALQLWEASCPLVGTLGDKYLKEHRRLRVEPLNLDHSLRWHGGINALVGLMTDPMTGEGAGIHRTILNPDGSKRERKMLGKQGVICLTPNEDVCEGLGLVEGVEDGLAVLLSGWGPIWIATSAGAIERFPVLNGIESLTIFADADAAGMKAAKACASRWKQAGHEVCISVSKELADAA